jgi:hypothetical protein
VATFVAGKATKCYVNGFDLSSFLNKASFKGQADMLDITVFGNNSKNYLSGLLDADIALEGFFDSTPTTGIDAVCAGILGSGAVGSVAAMWGGDAIGARGMCALGLESDYEVGSAVGEVVSATLAFKQTATGMEDVLSFHALGAEVGVVNSASVDNGAASAAGGAGYIHVPSAVALTTATIKIQHSVDNSVWTDLITFANVTATPNYQRIAVAGTVNRYLRSALTTLTGTSITYFAAFNRD